MSKRVSEIVVICEDQRHQSFINFYLKEWPVEVGETEFLRCPRGVGSAELWVRQMFYRELPQFRLARAKRRVALLLVVDADTMTVAARNRQLLNTIAEGGLDPVGSDEAVAILIPKRNVETWIVCLGLGDAVDELRDYRNDKRVEKRVIREAARRLYLLTRPNAPPPLPGIPSMIEGIQVLRRFESLLRN